MTSEEFWFRVAWFADFRARWQRDLKRARRFVYWQLEDDPQEEE